MAHTSFLDKKHIWHWIYAYKVPSKNSYSGAGIVIGGDTLVSSTQPYNSALEETGSTGVTSQNQFFSPYIDKHGYLNTFAESACKIGKLNNHTLVAACGNAELIQTILQVYYNSPYSINTHTDFFPRFTDDLCSSLSPMKFDERDCAEFLFAIYDNECATFVDMRYIVDECCNLRHQGKYWFPVTTQPAYFKGSGHELFSNFSGSFHFNALGLIDSNTIQQATAVEVSKHISKKSNGDARIGIGGAILTYSLDETGFQPPEDTIYINANRENDVSILSKVCYRDGYFYLVDFIERKLTGFAPLEVQINGIQSKSEEYIKSVVDDVSKFNAKWLFLTKELENKTDKKFEVIIQGNQQGSLFQENNAQDLLLQNIKNGNFNLTITNDKGIETFDFKIRQ